MKDLDKCRKGCSDALADALAKAHDTYIASRNVNNNDYDIYIAARDKFFATYDSNDAYWYCNNIKDRKSIRKLITDSHFVSLYLETVKERKSMRKKLDLMEK